MSVGRLVAQGSLAEVTGAAASRVRVHSSSPGDAAAVLHRLGLSGVAVEGDRAVADLGEAVPEGVLAELVRADVPVEQFVVDRPTLEDLFVALTGEGFDVER
jgi:ABC-2 type transport system ATP-binding protein